MAKSTAAKIDDNVIRMTPIAPADFQAAQHGWAEFTVLVDSHVPRETLTDHRLWAHVAAKLRTTAEIRVVARDCSWRALMFVQFADGRSVRMQELEYHRFDENVEIDNPESEFFVEHRGTDNWCFIRRSDGSVIKKNMPSQSAAIREMDDYARALSR